MKIYRKLKLGIVGHGFVGKATDWGFNRRVSKFIVDPLLNTNIEDLKEFEPEIVFICVPTPMSDDGSQDSSIIENVIKELHIQSKKYSCDAEAIVLAWLLKHPSKILPVIGSTQISRIKKCINSLKVDYSKEDWYRILEKRNGVEVP